MIDRQALKIDAKQNLAGKKPSVFLVAIIYIAVVGILSTLIYALSGYDRFIQYAEHVFPLNPYPTYEELTAFFPPIPPMAGVLLLVILLTRHVLDVGFMGYCLKISRNETTDIKSLFDGFSLISKIIVLEILQWFFIFLWSLLLVVPGFIAYYSYRQAFYILLDNPQLSPLACIRLSKQMMDGYKLELLFLDFSFIGWLVLDIGVKIYTALPLVSIWLAPYTGVTRAGFYNRLVPETAANDAGINDAG